MANPVPKFITPRALPAVPDHGSDDLSRMDWSGRRVTVMGLGRHGGGLGAARYLAGQGALVIISDSADQEALAESLAALSDLPLAAIKLGHHDEADFRAAEFVVVNPAVRPDHECLSVARRGGAMLISEIELFLHRARAHVIGVSGSNGKSTTCAMLAGILSAAGRGTWLGGNFGGSLLSAMDRMTADDWVVLELSSFQLAHLSPQAPMPPIAVLTNCTPNHLDWHGDFDSYASAKRRLVSQLPADGLAVFNPHDSGLVGWDRLAPGRTRAAWPLEKVPPLRVPGLHNRRNAALAASAAQSAGVSAAVIDQALRAFEGLPHRVQFVAEKSGRFFYNDSKSTTPAATMAALEAMDRPVWLLAGGHPKGCCFDNLAGAIVARTRGVGLFGAAREQIWTSLAQAPITARDVEHGVLVTEHLADALRWCVRQSQRGDAILLSPACASYDQFRDFQARGECFRKLVDDLEA